MESWFWKNVLVEGFFKKPNENNNNEVRLCYQLTRNESRVTPGPDSRCVPASELFRITAILQPFLSFRTRNHFSFYGYE